MAIPPQVDLARQLASRLERLSADSVWAHRASGVRGALLRWLSSRAWVATPGELLAALYAFGLPYAALVTGSRRPLPKARSDTLRMMPNCQRLCSEFFRAVVQIVKESGGTPILLESPAVHSLERTIKKTSYAQVVDSEKIEIANPAKTRTLHFDGAKKFKRIDIAEGYFDADIILALPKFKTHGITYITGGVKLLFGAIPGIEKSKMHLRAQTPEAFSEFLLDLYGAMTYGFSPPKPIIHIMDAILAQEYYYPYNIDLMGFADNLLGDAVIDDDGIKEAAALVRDAVDDGIFACINGDHNYKSSGIAIYLPTTNEGMHHIKDTYIDVPFATETSWYDFVYAFSNFFGVGTDNLQGIRIYHLQCSLQTRLTRSGPGVFPRGSELDCPQ